MSAAMAAEHAKPEDPTLDMDEIQGDVLVGLPKMAECFIFFNIGDDTAAFGRQFLQSVLHHVTTASVARADTETLARRNRGGAPLPIYGVNVGFTAAGLQRLGVDTKPMDPAFADGAVLRARSLNDPIDGAGVLTTWNPRFTDGSIHGVILVTGPSPHAVNAHADDVIARFG